MRALLVVPLLVACGPEAAELPRPTPPSAVVLLQHRVWRQLTPAESPPARAGHGMVYDSVRKRVLVFGGNQRSSGFTWFDDTWSFDGERWTNLRPAHHPPARAAAAMVFDAARDRVVLFGGASDTATLGDTWEFDGLDWHELHPAVSPKRRWSPASAWDPLRRRTVLFGGWAAGTASDTWEYDGSTWTQVAGAGGPPAAGYPIATFDTRAGQVAMFSSEVVDSQTVAHLWRFTGLVWEEQTLSPLPEGPEQTALASHPSAGLVQYGSIGKTGWTWTFDGTTSSLAFHASAPAGVNGQGLVSDTGQGRLLLFG